MIEFSGTGGYLLTCLLTPLRQGLFHSGEQICPNLCNRNTWCKTYPMAKKSATHETLSLLFAQEGGPNTLVVDGAEEQLWMNQV